MSQTIDGDVVAKLDALTLENVPGKADLIVQLLLFLFLVAQRPHNLTIIF
jgi:hypothetical protein